MARLDRFAIVVIMIATIVLLIVVFFGRCSTPVERRTEPVKAILEDTRQAAKNAPVEFRKPIQRCADTLDETDEKLRQCMLAYRKAVHELQELQDETKDLAEKAGQRDAALIVVGVILLGLVVWRLRKYIAPVLLG